MPPAAQSAQIQLRIGRQAIVDVAYRGDDAFAACLLVDDLSAAKPIQVITAEYGITGRYEPGRFYRRELPAILRVLEGTSGRLDTIVVDGYVWLDGEGWPGLGAKLYQALQQKVRVVGVAKSRFGDASHEELVWRGSSLRPLYVTAAGVSAVTAAAWIHAMHGAHRIPTLLQLADRISRRSVAEWHAEPCTVSAESVLTWS